uniref:Uncharacterized protein n=1 Tax=Lactuca sativa TaxID=4236 RepID=A0A9R1VJP5_LACSA|nr:hypothetical protein LSAT_V11C500263870 [Lactuca sativa]
MSIYFPLLNLFLVMKNTMCGTNLICGNIVPIKSLGDVYPNKSINLFCNFLMNLLVWHMGISFMGPFSVSFGNVYILFTVDYVS